MGAQSFDVIIVGGGFAGNAAGITLARALRSVAIFDTGRPRNRSSSHAHGVLGQDGANPLEFLRRGSEEFSAFGGTRFSDEILKIQAVETSVPHGKTLWEVHSSEGKKYLAAHVLVATGISDKLPAVPGLEDLWGQRVFHCPYCHGFEIRDTDCAVIGGLNPGFTFRMTHMLRNWTSQLTFYTNGLVLDAQQRSLYAARGVIVDDTPVTSVEADLNSPSGVVVNAESGRSRFESCFTGPDFLPNHSLLLDAGCEHANGWVLQEGGKTSVPGLWAAGNVTSSPDQISQAIGSAVATAIAIDQTLLSDELEAIAPSF
ncbi:NAD(P)/FAD-dependent oxidoreductase [Corynebacterium pseudodiphtheriticum]|uniref:NAD(P)/FAD-dependent oxidoreductase n=1 Tax=Corynebacterium pseudodiphtheriticum TaxID=37637 RepID=UPI00254FB320|nr:NAD(P)/FAD-dependent oxidoreductase [Corynebacterium pseudodiphtheriticum]MDK8479226.1 NAD(P)/FAD-dependent oxidoreductase [Corynebacterium pseudodiphtheriticum]MDK8487508.1 NAD(P)/FAD-dependent oxidoreductase [Corynebacterium pseudodiphtheriticum]MDK8494742.1 NAD(P)/FAD-dependent oxidoreductase [Corynebacterium pseudodiphtheriticum]